MSQRSNMFEFYENHFKKATKEEITNTAEDLFKELFVMLSQDDTGTTAAYLNALIVSAKMGTAGDGVLNKAEKDLLNTVFSPYVTDMQVVYDIVQNSIKPKDYQLIEILAASDQDIAMNCLKFILCFAYIDGKFEDDIAERLDNIFGTNLLMEFMQNGIEIVSATSSEITVSPLQKKIIVYLKKKDELLPLDDICKFLPKYSKNELKKALDDLCEKSICFGGDNLYVCMYALTDEAKNMTFTVENKSDNQNNSDEAQDNMSEFEKLKQKKAEIEAIREKKTEELKADYELQKTKEVEKITSEYEVNVATEKDKLAKLYAQYDALTLELNKTGAIHFIKRNNLNVQITEVNNNITSVKSKIHQLDSDSDKAIADTNYKYNQLINKIPSLLNDKYPLPIIGPDEKTTKLMNSIIDVIHKIGKPMTATEISNELDDYPAIKVRLALNHLVDMGKIEKFSERNKIYFF